MAKPAAPDSTIAGRIDVLLDFLQLRGAAFSRALGIDASTFSRLRNGHRGLDRDSAFVKRAATVFGVKTSYWFNDPFQNPCDCIDESLKEGSEDAPDDAKEIGTIAARMGRPAGMVVALLNTTPPPGAGAPWWIKRWAELEREHGVDLRAPSR